MPSENQTIEVGDIAIAVGSYKHATKGERKTRRNIGKLMQTTYADGGKSMWIKVNADALSPSLLMLALPHMLPGSDTVLLDIFEPRVKDAEGKP